MTNDEIREKALANGFKLKEQPDGTMDLSPYVFNAIRACQPQWIGINDARPEEDGLYLVLRKGFTFTVGNESDLVPKVTGWNGGRGCFDDDYGNVMITHWMPLPELPEGE